MQTEQELLQQVINGQPRAQHELYSRYAAMGMAVAMRYVVDRDVARDVLQDSFVKVFTRIGGFEYRGEGTLKSWVLRIVANESVDYLRSKDRLMFSDKAPEDLSDDVPDEEPDVGLLPPGVLQQMIKSLPPGYRIVLNLFVFEQHSHREIAQQLGISENTSALRFLRAKKQLARMIREYLDNPQRI